MECTEYLDHLDCHRIVLDVTWMIELKIFECGSALRKRVCRLLYAV